MKTVCIGNSNVNGFPHGRSRCWVSLLRDKTGGTVMNKGVNGETTVGILARFADDVIAHRPDHVIILSGTNDFVALELTPAAVMENLRRMADTALEHGIRPLLLTPCLTDPASPNLFNPGADYERVNRDLRALGVLIRDFGTSDASRADVFDLQNLYRFGFTDGVHLTLEGHAWLADALAERIGGA